LSNRVRETIALARLAGYSITAVARMMDLPVSTVANAHRARVASVEPEKRDGDMPNVPCANLICNKARSL
jgi:DNA-directed RNA polymerase specialized sigma24 family protein